jgi:formylglycine-generating enzyme required for sulfatase activity
MATLTIQRHPQTNRRFFEVLGNDVRLEMVLVPGGTFQMGSPEDELDRSDAESPQHSVTVPTFFMGRYPFTQAQWRQVAGFKSINRKLEATPSRFQGDLNPVERIRWDEAVEFCDLLSQHTGRSYRLPSEAEWEYACRAGTTSPFHFGETITDQLANYDATETYGQGPQGEHRQTTTPVTQFDAPNAFGLCDMHGNVWEWCQDLWYENYEGAPTDGSVWIEDGNDRYRVLRGGAWNDDPWICRSACRLHDKPTYRTDFIGFRVVCAIRHP